MKNKIYTALTKPYIVVLVMLFAPLLGFFDRNFSFFFGLAITFLILWSSHYKWSLFGFSKKLTMKTVLRALVFSVLLLIAFVPLNLVLDHYLGEANLSSLEDLKHNTVGYIITLIIVWVFAAFGEEILFRGYYLKWLAELLGNTKKAWIISAIILAIYFGISHSYQGVSGVISIIPFAFVYSLIYLKNRDNLWLLVFMHGIHDTIGLTFLYLDMTDPISTFFESLF
ncbi:type II CAAX endopeptidase family protein [uncultured Psychroserpens sp.]|uniref:CPBP family intramembrane glutamic endopeptidase n=1 Tax=uncultured Psychroserpens sp. TaxID=255436 RepID=UPI002619DCE1|nr:type II CAAX endopeptidase family protein [uncultured Psychroserpens sp.]